MYLLVLLKVLTVFGCDIPVMPLIIAGLVVEMGLKPCLLNVSSLLGKVSSLFAGCSCERV